VCNSVADPRPELAVAGVATGDMRCHRGL